MNLFGKITDYKSDFITYARTFEKYKWYKPILITILGIIFFLLLNLLMFILFAYINNFVKMDINLETIENNLIVIMIIPSIFLSSKIIKDRPFSSYLNLNNSWNWKVFFKSFAIALIIILIIEGAQVLFEGGDQFKNTFTILTFLAILIVTPLQCFAEELFSRGLFMQTFGSWFKIPILAIIIQGLIFASLHYYNAIGLLNIFIIGIGYGFIAWYSKGLEISSAIHTSNNLFVNILEGFTLTTVPYEIPIETVIISVLILVVTIITIIFIEKKFKWIGFNSV